MIGKKAVKKVSETVVIPAFEMTLNKSLDQTRSLKIVKVSWEDYLAFGVTLSDG